MPTPTLAPPAADDRYLMLHDVRARLPQKETGGCVFTDRWIREHVAPDTSTLLARQWAVRESAFRAWHDRWVAGTLTEAEKPRVRARGGKRRAA